MKRFKRFKLLFICLFVLAGTGWVKNIIKFSDCDFETPYKAEIVYGVGVITPIGVVTGWMDLGV